MVKCVVCGKYYAFSDVVVYCCSTGNCLCSHCIDSDMVKAAHDKHMGFLDYIQQSSRQGIGLDPDQEE